jgi:hypothetical protein
MTVLLATERSGEGHSDACFVINCPQEAIMILKVGV